MLWALFGTAFVLVVAVFAVAPRWSGGGRGFPWFWVLFPLTVLAVTSTVAFLVLEAPGSGPVEYSTVDVGYDPFFRYNLAAMLWPLIAVIGAVGSVIAWRKGRR